MKKFGFWAVLAPIVLAGCSSLQMEMVYDSTRTPMEYQYNVAFAGEAPELTDWFSASWNGAETGSIANFLFSPDIKTKYLPETKFKTMYGEEGVYVIFLIHDKYVISKYPMQGPVCRDSCVEFFFQIPGSNSYFNLEMAAGGNFLIYYTTNMADGNFISLPPEDYVQIKIFTSMPNTIFEESEQAQRWTIGAFIPFSLLSKYHGSMINSTTVKGQSWRCNFYKCASGGNPHWASWAKMPMLNFHQSEYFGYLSFK
jgi:hypothetical protein